MWELSLLRAIGESAQLQSRLRSGSELGLVLGLWSCSGQKLRNCAARFANLADLQIAHAEHRHNDVYCIHYSCAWTTAIFPLPLRKQPVWFPRQIICKSVNWYNAVQSSQVKFDSAFIWRIKQCAANTLRGPVHGERMRFQCWSEGVGDQRGVPEVSSRPSDR